MIRPTQPSDTPALIEIAQATIVFKPLEIVALREVLDDYHEANHEEEHYCITAVDEEKIVGFAYYALAAMTEQTWYLYWIAIQKNLQAKGIGTALLQSVEEDIRQRKGRLLLIETSSLPHYEPTRRFYLKHRYEQAAVVGDFYADGDDLVIFRKRVGG